MTRHCSGSVFGMSADRTQRPVSPEVHSSLFAEQWSDCGPIPVIWCLFNGFLSFPAASSRWNVMLSFRPLR